ncbi:MAG: hypothetical protein RIS64_3569 [Bacteroidota bacterium]
MWLRMLDKLYLLNIDLIRIKINFFQLLICGAMVKRIFFDFLLKICYTTELLKL